MRVFLLLLSLLALVPQCAAEISALEASRLLWYYTSYELDFVVEGRNRTIARGCKGSGTDNKCDFNEFLNFVRTGEASGEPKYFEVTSDFAFYIGDVAIILDGMRIAYNKVVNFNPYEFIVKGVKSETSLSASLGRLADRNIKAAKAKGKDVARLTSNMKTAIGAAQYQARIDAEAAMLKTMKNVKDLTVKTKERTSDYAKKATERLDWRATVEANKGLLDRNTQTFKDVSTAIRGQRNLASVMRDRTIAQRAGDVFSACFEQGVSRGDHLLESFVLGHFAARCYLFGLSSTWYKS